MQIPTSIRIGSFQYRVFVDNEAVDRKGQEAPVQDLLGYFEPDQRAIYLKEQAANQSVLFHEVLHAIADHTGMFAGRKGVDEESLVRVLEGPLLAVLRENPGLVRYLTEDSDSGINTSGGGSLAPLA